MSDTELEVPETMHIAETGGVKEPPPDQPKLEIYDPNKEVMDAIYAKRRKQLEDELVRDGLDTKETIDSTADTAEPESEKPVEPEPVKSEEPKPAQVQEETKLPEKVKLKIEGRVTEVPGESLIELAQKGLASTKTWEEAARMKEEAQRLMFQMNQNTQTGNPNTSQPAQPNTPSQPEPILSKEKAKEIAKRINYGSEDEQVAALLDLGATIESKVQGRSQGLPPEQIINVATQQAIASVKFEQDKAQIAKEFPEIFADKYLSYAAGLKAQDLVQDAIRTQAQRPVIDIWRDALTEVKGKYMPSQPQPQPVQAAPKVVVDNDRIERKRAAPKPPAAANKVAEQPAQPQGVSPSSIVAQMRKSRGQPNY